MPPNLPLCGHFSSDKPDGDNGPFPSSLLTLERFRVEATECYSHRICRGVSTLPRSLWVIACATCLHHCLWLFGIWAYGNSRGLICQQKIISILVFQPFYLFENIKILSVCQFLHQIVCYIRTLKRKNVRISEAFVVKKQKRRQSIRRFCSAIQFYLHPALRRPPVPPDDTAPGIYQKPAGSPHCQHS